MKLSKNELELVIDSLVYRQYRLEEDRKLFDDEKELKEIEIKINKIKKLLDKSYSELNAINAIK